MVLTYNAAYWTDRCLRSLFRWTSVPYELVIVDNGSGPDTLALLDRYQDTAGVTIVRNQRNTGFAGGNNLGLQHATEELVLFLNNDVIVTQGWLTNLVAALDASPGVAAVGPRTNHASGVQGGISLSSLTEQALHRFASHFNWHDPSRWYETDSLSGFAMLVRRSVLDEVGVFDERYEIGTAEDRELCDRIRKAGHALLCAGDSFVFHAGHSSFVENGLNFAHQNNLNRILYRDGESGGEPGPTRHGQPTAEAPIEDDTIVTLGTGAQYVERDGVMHPIANVDAVRLLPYRSKRESVSEGILRDYPIGDPVFFIRSWGATVYLFAFGKRHPLQGSSDRISRIPGVTVLRPDDLESIPVGEPMDVEGHLTPVSELPRATPRPLIHRFEERILGTDAVASEIRNRLEFSQPLSLIRLGSGEALVLNDGVVSLDRSPFMTDYSGAPTVPEGLRPRLVEAIRDADIVGLTTERRIEYCAPLLESLFTHFHIAPERMCSGFVNWSLIGVDRDTGERLVEDAPLNELLRDRRVAVVGRRAAEARECRGRLGWNVTVSTDVDGLTDIERAFATLRDHRHDFDIALVSAGIPAIILCPLLARETGCVAIDFGHSLNYLLNPLFNETTLVNEKLRWRFERYVGELDRSPPSPSALEGKFCRAPGGAVYYIERGRRRSVPSPAVLDVLKPEILDVPDRAVEQHEVGLPLMFVVDELAGAFLVKDGRKVPVDFGAPLVGADPDALLQLPTSPETLQWRPRRGAAGRAEPVDRLDPRSARLLRAERSGAVYVVQHGRRQHVAHKSRVSELEHVLGTVSSVGDDALLRLPTTKLVGLDDGP